MARLGELLVASGLLTPERLEQALRAQIMWGARLGTNLVEAQARYSALHSAAAAFRSGRAAALEDRTALLEKLWRAGEISTSDYLVQLKQSLDTALSGLQLESQVWQAWFDYLTAAGRLTDWIDGRTQDAYR